MINSFNHQHGGNLEKASNKYGIPVRDLIDFSANINPLGPPVEVFEAIKKASANVTVYPDPDCLKAKVALSNYFNISKENFVIGNGASELIYVLMYTLKPSKILVPVPTFSEYTNAAMATGIPLETVELSGELFECLDATSLNIDTNSLIILCNPNNPTGGLYEKTFIREIIAQAYEKKAWVLLDESFIDFVEDQEKYSFIQEINQYENLLILYSLTKFYAIPGIRLGSIITNATMTKKLSDHKDPWSVNCFALEASEVALGNKEYFQTTRNYMFEARQLLYEGLLNIKGLIPKKPTANYIFTKVDPFKATSSELCDFLGKKGILLRNCNTYPLLGEGYVRIAVKSKQHNEVLLRELKLWK